jgi:hypothetical protein
VFPGGACLAGSDDPAKYGNYQQTQKQSKPTHATKLAGGILGKPIGLSARIICLTCLALLSASIAWIGVSIGKLTNWRKRDQCASSL